MQVSGWHSLATINTIIEIQKVVSFTNFVYLQQDYFIISDLFQDIVQIKNSCFWKIKVNCASARLMSFFSESGYANLSGPTHRLPLSIWWREREYWYISRIYFFHHVLRVLLFVNYLRFGQFYKVFPTDNETKNNIK